MIVSAWVGMMPWLCIGYTPCLTPPNPPPCPPPPPPELDPSEAAASDPATGELKFGWSNICLHYFRRDWLEAVSGRLASEGRYHIARKKIPSKDGPVAVSGWVGGGEFMLASAGGGVGIDLCSAPLHSCPASSGPPLAPYSPTAPATRASSWSSSSSTPSPWPPPPRCWRCGVRRSLRPSRTRPDRACLTLQTPHATPPWRCTSGACRGGVKHVEGQKKKAAEARSCFVLGKEPWAGSHHLGKQPTTVDLRACQPHSYPTPPAGGWRRRAAV